MSTNSKKTEEGRPKEYTADKDHVQFLHAVIAHSTLWWIQKHLGAPEGAWMAADPATMRFEGVTIEHSAAKGSA